MGESVQKWVGVNVFCVNGVGVCMCSLVGGGGVQMNVSMN